MSEVAGRMAVQVGAKCLEKEAGGIGKLLGGVPGVAPAQVVILGGGTAGANAALIALGMQADVTILDKSVNRLRWLADRFGSGLRVVMANPETMHEYVVEADLVIGAVLVPGAASPKLVSREMVREMRDGSVLVDISIDQGGCFETSRPTTHAAPTYVDEGVVHYCVTNMPGAVAHTSALALNNATLPFVKALADKGLAALAADPHLAAGLERPSRRDHACRGRGSARLSADAALGRRIVGHSHEKTPQSGRFSFVRTQFDLCGDVCRTSGSTRRTSTISLSASRNSLESTSANHRRASNSRPLLRGEAKMDRKAWLLAILLAVPCSSFASPNTCGLVQTSVDRQRAYASVVAAVDAMRREHLDRSDSIRSRIRRRRRRERRGRILDVGRQRLLRTEYRDVCGAGSGDDAARGVLAYTRRGGSHRGNCSRRTMSIWSATPGAISI